MALGLGNLFKGLGSSSLQNLFEEKRQVLNELKVIEKKYMKRELSLESYKEMLKKKHAQLIKIDSRILQKQAKQENLPKEDLLAVEPKDRHVLVKLLSENQRLQRELQLARAKYLKRKIDEQTYKSILHSVQESLIEIEAKIKNLRLRKSIRRAFSELKQKVDEAETEVVQKEKEEAERVARDVLEQV
ncbi:MAG: hypothetical protein JW772_02080 [Candidatus Diapherotrites archaeon]|nr:hypothetical protein [Candidatus Diapherotrites archaeon]